MSGRIYTTSFQGVAATVVQDIFELTAPSTGMFRILSAHLSQESDEADAQAEMLPLQWTRYATSGSGGSTPTENPHLVGNAATGVTTEANNTTQGGTPTVIWASGWNVQIPWIYQPSPQEYIWVPPSGIIALEMPSAPADSLTLSGSVTYEEVD
jgi:hypothetical protein